ncbi:MAG: cation transporter, partial [Hylemonella sp.]
MSTTRVALTAHLVMPQGHPGDDFLREVSVGLHERFGIDHATLQTVTAPMLQHCHDPGRRAVG